MLNTHPIILIRAQAALALWAQRLPSRMEANRAIWAAGLALQCALAFTVFRRGVARKYPGFAALILFYPVRAGALFALAGRADSDTYNSLYNVLAFIEIPLQAYLILELAIRLVSALGQWTRDRIAAVLMLLVVACGLTWVALNAVPEKQLADRVQVLIGFLMLALFAAAGYGSRSRNILSISGGFAVFAAIQLAALAGRAHAMIRHNAGEYVAWSYAPACGYLVIVVFWLASLAREPKQIPNRAPV